ncbi:hypothetical protein MLD38_003059 [Melastoma candidum]|uniref:Uncharacterized protein n=1 Tax=Melastoma candidum TaxID=119954 RepID=A0ACB9S9Y8_9MYRT|nr:hypothetical protein MLD38_003059 [Melastoma candidum]
MSPSPFSFAAAFLVAALVFGNSAADLANPLFSFCFNPENVTSRYQTNLDKLLASLYKNVPPTGFGTDSVGKYPDQVYGLALCRGDVSPSDCSLCLTDARDEIPEICPNNQGVIVWYDNCLLKFDDADFLGKIDSSNKFYLYNVNSVTDPAVFNKKTSELLTKLAGDAYAAPNLFASGEGEAKGYTSPSKKKAVLYGMVQCTRDLSASDCKKCLDEIIGELPSCCDGKEGGRVISGSCNFRYEVYPFLSTN